MQDFILQNYLWFKAFHLIAVISWMAGLLYLPRLYVYHVGAKKDSDLSETLKVMERRLLRFIMNPAMIITWALGLLMLWSNAALLEQGWMHAKLALVILMSVLHMMFAKWRKTFAVDENTRSAKFYKIWNEAPTLLMIAIVVLAVVKPF
jgi:putative membrane protein